VRSEIAAALDVKHAALVEVLQQYNASEIAYLHALSDEARELHASGTRMLGILTLTAALIAVTFVWWLARSISSNLRHAVAIAKAISDGKFDNEIVSDNRDEAGEMLSALKLMQTNLFDNFRNLELHNRDLALMTELSNLLQTATDLNEAAGFLSRTAGKALAPHVGAIYLTAASLNRLDCIAQWGEAAFPRVLSPEDCLGMRRGNAYSATDAANEVYCRHVQTSAEGLAYVCVPMMMQGLSLGMVHVRFVLQSVRPEELMAERLRVQRIADQIALALANLKLRETLRDQSTRDVLTGLFNRRYLEESLDREFARAQRDDLPLSVLMLDVDHFKRYNDTHGHAAGDAMLRSLGRLLKETTRAGDLVCRFGGEEFTAVLPSTPAAQAVEWATRLMERIRELTVVVDGETLPGCTLSMGLACYPENCTDVASLLQAADSALYKAKHAGRDRLEYAAMSAISASIAR
jgi:diguanylate cyclase (GGDEF)-like protein